MRPRPCRWLSARMATCANSPLEEILSHVQERKI
jgi:hypothetical protein